MAKWKETLEPYVKVIESVKSAPLNPRAGEDMIVGAVIISDSGPATPTLITSQREYLKTFAAEDLTQGYTDSLNDLYVSDPGSPLASTMWLNAYRLAGTTNMLVCRASKAKDLIYAKPIARGDQNQYVLKNTEVLKRVNSFKLVLDKETIGWTDGWAISVSDTGIIGNRVTDDGPIYDYKVDTLPDLVDQLNDTTKFFSPTFEFYTDAKCTPESLVEGDDIATYADDIVAVLFKEVYLGSEFLDTLVPLDDTQDNANGGVVIYDDLGNVVSPDDDRYPLSDEDGRVYDVEFDSDGNEKPGTKTYWPAGAYDLDGNLVGDGLNDYQVIGATGSKYEIKGMSYILAVDPDWEKFNKTDLNDPTTPDNPADDTNTVDYNQIIDLNSKAYSGFEEVPFYATNLYNSRSNLQVRIRRFNHNAVVTKVTSDVPGMAPESPYTIATKVLDKFTNGGTQTPKDSILKYDFWEFAVFDPDISDDWQLFNVGQIGGRGDITVADLNDNLSMLHLTLPDDLHDLELNYYGYNPDNYSWIRQNVTSIVGTNGQDGQGERPEYFKDSLSELPEIKYKKSGKLLKSTAVRDGVLYGVLIEQHYSVKKLNKTGEDEVGSWVNVTEDTADLKDYVGITILDAEPTGTSGYGNGAYIAIKQKNKSLYDYYKLTANGQDEINLNLSLKRTNPVTGEVLTTILDVSDNDLMQAWDRIEEDERYVVEGMTDLGNTYSILQNYMANIAVNSNYFYAASTINSTNYMTIANKKQKITKDTSKLYFLAPWDYDDGTVGYLFNASPSVLYWECISRNRMNNNQFAPAFGQTTGIVTPVNLTTDFKKSERQLLLTKKINTVFYDINIDRIYINDSYTAQSTDDIRKEENIERAIIHISKNMPTLLNQFKGRINSQKTRQAVESVIGYWFKTHMIPVSGELIDDYQIICDDPELNSPEEIRANRLNVIVNVRFLNAVKYITVYNVAYPIGVEFENHV